MLYIGIDLGTSACKFLLTDTDGTVKRTVTEEYPLSFPHPGWSEQEPSDWWNACLNGIPKLLDGFDCSLVRGIAAGGQMHGLVALDDSGRVLRPAILWNDGRTGEEVTYLNDMIGPHRPDDAAQGLSGLPAHRLLFHRLFRCVRHAPAGCEKSGLVPGNAQPLRAEAGAASPAS